MAIVPGVDYIDRVNAHALIPPEIAREIIQGALKYSVGLRIFRRVRNMLRDELLMPALSMLPQGGWLNSDNAIKPLTSQAWEMVEMYAEEYAACVIIPDNVREDAAYDIWGEILPRLSEVYGKVFDQAVFMGIDKPCRFRADLVTAVSGDVQGHIKGLPFNSYDDGSQEWALAIAELNTTNQWIPGIVNTVNNTTQVARSNNFIRLEKDGGHTRIQFNASTNSSDRLYLAASGWYPIASQVIIMFIDFNYYQNNYNGNTLG